MNRRAALPPSESTTKSGRPGLVQTVGMRRRTRSGAAKDARDVTGQRTQDLLRDFFCFGTLAPARRACESPIAIACARLVTFIPDWPLRSVPRLRLCMAFSTFFSAALPYFAIAILRFDIASAYRRTGISHASVGARPRSMSAGLRPRARIACDSSHVSSACGVLQTAAWAGRVK
jgi:hypothetical protein